jgi:histidinol-phosphate aminotransferase
VDFPHHRLALREREPPPYVHLAICKSPTPRPRLSYEPGKPVEDVARELGLKPSDIIKLASNENPLGPSPKALVAMREALERAHFYPDGGGYYLREAIAEKFGLGAKT